MECVSLSLSGFQLARTFVLHSGERKYLRGVGSRGADASRFTNPVLISPTNLAFNRLMDERLEEKNKKETTPAVGRAVLVEHEGVRCMAFRDNAGKWRNYFNGDLLPETVHVLDEST